MKHWPRAPQKPKRIISKITGGLEVQNAIAEESSVLYGLKIRNVNIKTELKAFKYIIMDVPVTLNALNIAS